MGMVMKKLLYLFAFVVVVGALAGGNKNDSPSLRSTTASSATASSRSSNFMDDIHEKVIRDAERQYQIASSSGGNVERCVHAGLVAAAYLQAHNQPSYQSWKMREDRDCHR